MENENMRKYDVLLFDLDDTILDFKKGEQAALTSLFKEMNVENIQKTIDDYIVLNKSLWNEMEKGTVTREYVLNNRFSMLFNSYDKIVDGEQVELRYRYYLDLQHDYIEGAHDILKDLCKDYKIYIITNGVSTTQLKRIKDSKLEHCFINVFVSEDIGYQKPAKEYFEAVTNKIPDINIRRTLIIGDSLTADIKGGIVSEIDTCWFNPHKIDNLTDIKPNYEIHKLSDLYQIIK
jgi:2-haloacid dehalogenase